jgi:hypothetical protein
MRFITQCSRCKYQSTRDESFLELDINIKVSPPVMARADKI